MPASLLLLVVATGAVVGFLGGMLGKGGSALATPVLAAFGIPPIIALASPLPATVPGSLVAADRYRRLGLIDWRVLRWSLGIGLPATVVGALGSKYVDGSSLVMVTDVLLVGLGLRMLRAGRHASAPVALVPEVPEVAEVAEASARATVAVALVTGLAAGLLANSGGFLLAPLFVAVLGMSIKPAFGTSLAVASVLAVPGTLVHLGLGHLDPEVVVAFAIGSIPLAGVGAKVALSTDSARLERGYGVVLVLFGLAFLIGPHL
ncbi:MAG: sulfite exporter TauE/SafE family protein [Acidimicrobiales bacterium]